MTPWHMIYKMADHDNYGGKIKINCDYCAFLFHMIIGEYSKPRVSGTQLWHLGEELSLMGLQGKGQNEAICRLDLKSFLGSFQSPSLHNIKFPNPQSILIDFHLKMCLRSRNVCTAMP